MKRAQMNWRIVSLLIAIIFLLLMLIFAADIKVKLLDISELIIAKLVI